MVTVIKKTPGEQDADNYKCPMDRTKGRDIVL